MNSKQTLKSRIALITGSSRGIGAAIAQRFASEGAHVILTARTVAGLEEIDDEIRAKGIKDRTTLLPMDIKNYDDIEKLGDAILRRFGRLDIYVANAAILGDLTPLSQVEPEKWEEIINVNLTAQWRLLRALEPALLASAAGRAIFLTSGVSGGRAYWAGYAVTKSGLDALAKTWADELQQTKIKVNLVNPGAVRTSMRADAYPGEDPNTLPQPSEITDIFVQLGSIHFTETGKIFKAQ
ncbi:MAG: oxidoreductase [Rhodospirillaceae bacterium]|nr:oxidoreductase [Rhodospirillaceae bacterium]|tara:strand:+ start:1003 stop:1719 length:717 start_codon:yes stop_codon:yes gene_type:complete